jgi:hypothetical protein
MKLKLVKITNSVDEGFTTLKSNCVTELFPETYNFEESGENSMPYGPEFGNKFKGFDNVPVELSKS